MSEFHDGERTLQDRFDSRRLADAVRARAMHHLFTEADRQFIERMDMFFLATADASGKLDCSYKGGDPGFVRVVDERTLAFPHYDGNGMFMSTGNLMQNSQVGMLFVDWTNPGRMRVNGRAYIDFDDPLLSSFPGAQFVVRVEAEEVFVNCPRYIHRMELVERSAFVPRADTETPEPGWKDHFAAVLPEAQRAKRAATEGERSE